MPEYKWPEGTDVTFFVDDSRLPAGVSASQFGAAVNWAAQWWTWACGVKLDRVDSASQARVIVQFWPLDPTGQELGLTQEPAEGVSNVQHWMRLNLDEAWTVRRLSLTCLHELGHAIGLEHAPDGVKSIMSAYLDETLNGLTSDDIAQAQKRYGPPATTPPRPSSPATSLPSVNIKLPDGSTLRLELSLLAPGT